MSRKTKKSPKRSDAKVNHKGFKTIPLPEGTSLEGLAVFPENDDLISVLEDLLDAGYKVSVSKHWDSGARVVAITGHKPHCQNVGWTTSTWASGIEGGIYGSYWKAFVYRNGAPWHDELSERHFEV